MDYLSPSLVIGGYLLTLLLVPYAFFQKRKQPVSTLAWITAIVTLPYLGSLLFLLIGINRVERRAALKLASRQEIGRRIPALARFQLLPGEALDPQTHRLLRPAPPDTPTPCWFANSVALLSNPHR